MTYQSHLVNAIIEGSMIVKNFLNRFLTKKIFYICITVIIVFLSFFLIYLQQEEPTNANAKAAITKTVQSTQPSISIPFTKVHGGRVDWSHTGNDLIAFDKKGSDGYYDIYTMSSNGNNEKCLTCNHSQLPNKHQGQPAWHPSGEWIVFQAEKRKHFGLKFAANPGIGVYNDLWVISPITNKAYQLTNIPNNANSGILHPHFSHDGKQLLWAEMYEKADIKVAKKEFGLWKIKIANFSITNRIPSISNIREYQPSGPAWYETHSFSADDSTIYFTSNAKEQKLFQADIFAYKPASNKLTRLTNSGYNEHSQISPDGKTIVWMHTDDHFSQKGTDLWIMKSDGSNKRQLTFFRDKGNTHYSKNFNIAADSSWNAAGDKLVGYIQSSLDMNTEYIVVIELKNLLP